MEPRGSGPNLKERRTAADVLGTQTRLVILPAELNQIEGETMAPISRWCMTSLAVAFIGAAATANAQTAPEAAAPAEEAAPAGATPAAMPPPVATTAAGAGASVTDQPGVSLSARLAYAVPMGSLAQGTTLSDGISGGIPIVLEAAYRFNRNLSLGLAGQYAYMMTKNCDAGASCSSSDYQIFLEGIYNARMGSTIDPWVGLGIGYEQLTVSESAGGTSQDVGVSGWGLATVQVGGNFVAAPQVEVGPFLSFSVGKYGTASSGSQSADIPMTAFHEWLQIGVRGTFNL